MIPTPLDPNIAEIEDNVLTYYKGFTLALGGTFNETDSLVWFTTGRAYFPRFNGVLRSVLPPGQDLASVVDPLLEYFVSNHLPFFWANYPPGEMPGLEDYLRAKGVLAATYSLQAMGCSLSELPANTPPPDIEISVVRGPESLHPQPGGPEDQAARLDIRKEGFQEPEQTRPDFGDYVRRTCAEPQLLFQNFLARWQGAPAATASLLRAHRAAGLYHVTTLPAFRRRGLGKAITLSVMQTARQMGYDRMVLLATPDGYPLYQGLGYKTAASLDLFVCMGSAPGRSG
jgi:GNAT superfamily N-acetyltransferase